MTGIYILLWLILLAIAPQIAIGLVAILIVFGLLAILLD